MHFLTFDPQVLSTAENYKLLIGSIVPRPIAFVSTLSAEGVPNLAPFSFFNGVASNPPTLLFSTVRRSSDNQKKDTLNNIETTQEFVVNVVSESIAEPMNACAEEFPPEVNEFRSVGLTEAPSILVKAPRVLESPISMECRLNQIVTIGSGQEVGNAFVIIGTIIQFHIRSDVYTARGHIDIQALKPIARLAGSAYCPVREIFEIARP